MTKPSDQRPPLPYRADYHMHTKWCEHAVGEMRDYVESALAHGLSEMGFSIHMPIPIPVPEKLCLSREQVPLYVAELRRLQDEYAGRIRILMGGECDYIPGREREIEAAIAACPFDYVYGSVHYIDGWGFDSPLYKDRWTHADVAAVYRRYYELLADAARTGYFDIVGHFDLVKKFGYRPETDVRDAEAAAIDAIVAAGMTVEINTAGFDLPAGEQYPAERILRLLHARGVPLCLGSDSHRPEHITRHFTQARQLARTIGWTHVARYAARRRYSEPLNV